MTTDTAKPLMEISIHALLILLDYGNPIAIPGLDSNGNGSPSDHVAVSLPYVSPEDTDAQGFNVFRRLMASIVDPDHLNFIYRGFVRLLNNVHQSQSTYLPYSITRIEIEQVSYHYVCSTVLNELPDVLVLSCPISLYCRSY